MEDGIINLFNHQNGDTNKNKDTNKKYAQYISHFYGHFHKELSKIKDPEEKVELLIGTWNTAIIMKGAPESIIQEGLETTFPKHLVPLLKKIIEFKKEKYPNNNRMISNFEFNYEDTDPQLQIETESQEEFRERMREYDDEFNLEQENLQEQYEPGYINRAAIILIHKPPFFKWANSLAEDQVQLNKSNTSANTYLLKDLDMDLKHWLKTNYDEIFEQELFSWWQDETKWPKKRNYTLFNSWFQVIVTDSVLDLENSPVLK